MSSVTTYIYSDAVDSVVENSFTSTCSDPPFVSMAESEADNFSSMLEANDEHSRFGASISIMVARNNEGYELFYVSDDLTFIHCNKIDFASVSSVQAGTPKTISADFLSKIWNIDNSTAKIY